MLSILPETNEKDMLQVRKAAGDMLREMAINFENRRTKYCSDCEDTLDIFNRCGNCNEWNEGVLNEDDRELVEFANLTADTNPLSETAVDIARRLK